jgi:hypothetical protein
LSSLIVDVVFVIVRAHNNFRSIKPKCLSTINHTGNP